MLFVNDSWLKHGPGPDLHLRDSNHHTLPCSVSCPEPLVCFGTEVEKDRHTGVYTTEGRDSELKE